MSTVYRKSRSAMSTRKSCEMKGYLTYYYNTTGVTPKDFPTQSGEISMSALPKVRGTIFHELSLAIIQGATPKDVHELVEKDSAVFPSHIRSSQAALIRRAMLGWERVRGPWWREHFDVISAEDAWTWYLSPQIAQPLRMDKILKRKSDGLLGIFDFKTLTSVDPNWSRRMAISDQTHLYIQALKEYSQSWILGMCYDGVVVGSMRKGVQKSPFVTGYLKANTMSPVWSAGSTTVDLSTYSDEKWLEWILKFPGTLEELYCTTTFINPPPALLLHTKASMARAEEEFQHRVDIVETIRSTYGDPSDEYTQILGLIEKNPDQCYKYGVDFACPFVRQCWDGYQLDPDEFEPRKDHHAGDTDAKED